MVVFGDLLLICTKAFGEPPVKGSHHVFKVPWLGQPLVNLQKDGKMAKPYQVKQVTSALNKYTYRAEWSEEDDVFIARTLEMPNVLAHADTPESRVSLNKFILTKLAGR